MRVIIPLAGSGTRLRPHTWSKPKPLLTVAGKPILGHILDSIKPLKPDEVIFITGAMADQINHYVSSEYDFKTSYYEQKELLGDAHAIYQAHEKLDGEIFIIFNDTLTEANFQLEKDADANVFVHKVEDPRRFGVVILDNQIAPDVMLEKSNWIKKIVEKPDKPISNLAIIGAYYFKDGKKLKSHIEYIMKHKISTKNEYRLADAMQHMLETGDKLLAKEAKVWLDTGKPETVLETNRYLLEHMKPKAFKTDNSVIIPPVFIGKNSKISNSIIGPNVSIADDVEIIHSMIEDSIIGKGAVLRHVLLTHSIIGDNAVIEEKHKKLNLGDNSEIKAD